MIKVPLQESKLFNFTVGCSMFVCLVKQAGELCFALAGRGLDGRDRVGQEDPPVLLRDPCMVSPGGRTRRRG